MKRITYTPIALIAASASLLTACCLRGRAHGQATPATARTAALGPVVQGLRVEVSTTNSETAIGQSIWLELALQNVSTNATFVPVNSFASYSFDIRGPDGKPVAPTERGAKFLTPGFYSPQALSLPPGQSYTIAVPLGDMFEMTNSGAYTVTVSVKVPKDAKPQEQVRVPSGMLGLRLRKPEGPP